MTRFKSFLKNSTKEHAFKAMISNYTNPSHVVRSIFYLKSSGVGCSLLPFYDLEILSPHQLFKRKKFMGKHFSCESNANTTLIVVDLILFQGSRQCWPCYGHYSKCQVINYQNKIYEGISKTIFGSTLKNRIKMINTSRH